MLQQYCIKVVDLPHEARKLWRTDMYGVADAVSRVEAVLQQQGMDRCFVLDVVPRVGLDIGFHDDQPEHVRAVASVYRGWFSGVKPIATPADIVRLSPSLFFPQERDMQTVAAYEVALKNHLLKVRYGRPSTPPIRPRLVDLFESHFESVAAIVGVLAERGGLAWSQEYVSSVSLVTWTREAPEIWLARWREAVPEAFEVKVVDELPLDWAGHYGPPVVDAAAEAVRSGEKKPKGGE